VAANRPSSREGSIKRQIVLYPDVQPTALQLGGVERLVAWVKEDKLNERAYWTTMLTKLLPLQVGAADPNGSHMQVIVHTRLQV
jgi:hypothetical protein